MKINEFNDNLYIGKNINKDLVNEQVELSKAFIIENKINRERYNELFTNYLKFISIIGEFLKEFKLSDNQIMYSIFIERLIKEGIFSTTDYITSKTTKELLTKPGINIVAGEGVCRNYTDFIYSLYKYLEMYSERFFCNTYQKDKNHIYDKPNHMLNIIEYKNHLYGYDFCNNSLLKFINGTNIKECFTNDKLIYHLKPVAYLLFDYSINDIEFLIEKYKNESFKFGKISSSKYIEFIVEADDIYNQNYRIIKKFNKDTMTLKKEIVKELKKTRK